MLTVKKIDQKKTWEEFLSKKEIAYYPFFQCWNWGDVQNRLGFQIFRLGLFNSSKLIGVCLTIDVPARRGHYLHLRHGPVFLKNTESNFTFFVDHIKKNASEQNAAFLRVSPLVVTDTYPALFFKQQGAIRAPIHNMDAQICSILDITRTEDELLMGMRKSHRYLIRKAQKMDITITRASKKEQVQQFLDFYKEFSHRKGFVGHSGVIEEYEEFKKDDQAVLFLAEYKNKLISAALIAYVGSTAIYRHSASLAQYRDIPASYLIQWESIKEAQKRKKTSYNFWGIAKEEDKNHPWQGLTLFKTGFGGQTVEFTPAYDFPLKKLYWKTYVIDLITKWKKGY